MNENELKHWGILNMKWGIRRFQNPDGSLTEEGRKRYGVGPAREKKDPTKMSDDELYRATKRNKALANYYSAQNDYIRAQSYYTSLTNPPKKTSQFLQNVLIQPTERILSKTFEFTAYAGLAALLDATGNQNADKFLNYAIGGGNKNNNNRQRDDDDDDNRNDYHRNNNRKNDRRENKRDNIRHNDRDNSDRNSQKKSKPKTEKIFVTNTEFGPERGSKEFYENLPNLTPDEWSKIENFVNDFDRYDFLDDDNFGKKHKN